MRSFCSAALVIVLVTLVLRCAGSPVGVPGTPYSPNAAVITRSTLAKRKDPDTAGDIVEPQVSIIEKGFKDVMELSSYVLTATDRTAHPIFLKYFNAADEDVVTKVFRQILGNPKDPANPDPTGNDLLGDILVQKGDRDGQCAGGRALAYMGDHNTDNPFIVVCDALFQHKRIFDTKCEDLGDTVSYKMLTIGATLLHEYT